MNKTIIRSTNKHLVYTQLTCTQTSHYITSVLLTRNHSLSDFLEFPAAERPVFSSEAISLDDEPGLYSNSPLDLFISVFLRFNIDF